MPSNVISFMLLEAATQWQTHQGCVLNHLLHISRTYSFVGSECTSNDEPQLLCSIPLINLLIYSLMGFQDFNDRWMNGFRSQLEPVVYFVVSENISSIKPPTTSLLLVI